MKHVVLCQCFSSSLHLNLPSPHLPPTQVIDPISPRYTALLKSEVVPLHIIGAVEEGKMCPKHPKVPPTVGHVTTYKLGFLE